MACDEITIDSPAECPLPPAGTRARAGFINMNDLDEDNPYTEDANGRIIEIHLKAGKKMFVVSGFDNEMKRMDDVVEAGLGPNQFKHAGGIVVYERTQEQRNNVEAYCRGAFLALFERKGKDADAMEMLGAKCGVRVVPGTIMNAHENGGFFVLNFATATSKNEFEPKLPQVVGLNYGGAIELWDSLVTPAE